MSCFCCDRFRNLLYYIDSIFLDFSHLSIMQPASASWVHKRTPRGAENIEMVLPFPSLRRMSLSAQDAPGREEMVSPCPGVPSGPWLPEEEAPLSRFPKDKSVICHRDEGGRSLPGGGSSACVWPQQRVCTAAPLGVSVPRHRLH